MLKVASGAISAIMIIFGFLIGIFKPMRTWVSNKVKKIASSDNTIKAISEMNEAISDMKAVLERQIQASEVRDVATASIIRNEITKIYHANLETRTMPAREKENMLMLYESFANLEGSKYISSIVDEMTRWEAY